MDMLGAVWRALAGGDVGAGKRTLEAIQDLLVRAIRARKGGMTALTAEETAPIKVLCDQLLPANLALSVPDSATSDKSGPTRSKHVHYQHIYEDETFSIGIFILPPGVGIPLHDHPGMSVISRVLYGSLHLKSYDLVCDAAESTQTDGKTVKTVKTARLRAEKVLAAPSTTDLLPDCGNLHEFVGGDEVGCAIFDILTPPYDAAAGRDCTYYRVAKPAADGAEQDTLVTLESFEPEDLEVLTEPYSGPRLQRYV